jgi:Tfp pilus assembly protein PilW
MKKLFRKSNSSRSGVTLVEFLVAFSIFIVIISIAGGSFVRSARTQRAALQLMAVNDNMGITIEQMMREIRTGYNFCTGLSPLTDAAFVGACPDPATGSSELQFVTAGNVVTRYRLNGTAIQKGIAGAASCPSGDLVGDICYRNITADNVKVTKAYFESRYNNSEIPPRPPRIIISLSITSTDPLVESMISPMTIQTTVSARCGVNTCPSDM